MSKFQQFDMIGGQAIDANSSSQKHQLGLRCKAIDTASTDYGVGEFIYLKGVASTAIGSVVTYNEDDFSTALSAANASGQVAIAMAATVAGEFGWYQISGKGVAKVLTGFADNALCYATGTAGSIDDAVVAGDRIKRMRGASAIGTPSAGLAEVEMQYPFMDDGAAA